MDSGCESPARRPKSRCHQLAESMKKLFPSRHSSRSLSVELVLKISRYLPAHSTAAVCLTCKKFYRDRTLRRIWTRGLSCTEQDGSSAISQLAILRSDIRNYECLLLTRLLERDLPGFSACDFCHKLHPQREVPTKMNRNDCESWSPCPRYPAAGMWLHYNDWNLHISSEHIQQVMKRHFLGDRFGAPLESIRVSTDWQQHYFSWNATWMRKLELKPMIIGQLLLLYTSQHILMPQEDIKSLGFHVIASLASLSLKVCQCNRPPIATGVYSDMMELLKALFMDSSDEVERFSVCHACPTCLTDYAIALHKMPYRLLGITLNSWTILGSKQTQPFLATYDEAWCLASSHLGIVYDFQDVEKLRPMAERKYNSLRSNIILNHESQMATVHQNPIVTLSTLESNFSHPSLKDYLQRRSFMDTSNVLGRLTRSVAAASLKSPPRPPLLSKKKLSGSVERQPLLESKEKEKDTREKRDIRKSRHRKSLLSWVYSASQKRK